MFIVADDCVSILRLMKWKLQLAFGKEQEVLIVLNGVEVVETFTKLLQEGRQPSIDAILMDYHMPEMSGHDAIVKIRELEVQGQVKNPVPIIGFSADISTEMNELLLSGGADFLISKPPEPGALEELCTQIMKNRNVGKG